MVFVIYLPNRNYRFWHSVGEYIILQDYTAAAVWDKRCYVMILKIFFYQALYNISTNNIYTYR